VRIAVRGLVKRFGTTTAVDGATLDIADGELFTLLGPSGCGKTTLLRLIAGFYRPDAGEIWFGERRVDGLPPYARNIGMVFQNYALWPHMTVRANVSYGLRLRKLGADEIARRLEEGLRQVNLAGLEDRYPGQLSGGQQQRVALARALVLNPDILPARRAAVQPRRQDPRAGAERDPAAAAGARHHDRLRDPRSGGGAVPLGPGGGDARWSPAAGGHAQGTLRAPGPTASWPTSSAPTTSSPASAPSRDAAGSSSTPAGPGAGAAGDDARAGGRLRAGRAPGERGAGRGRRTSSQGRVAFASYLGDTLRYDVETESGLVLKVDVRDSWHHRMLPSASRCKLGFPPRWS
jgi:ABC-type ATPase involved in cell division